MKSVHLNLGKESLGLEKTLIFTNRGQ